uniref:Uncharacterized protein n=1 Tax=Nelumbo nucifera TaxID=4432 RepID=A0A822YK41_NELNU|nr:TPA_asm: hypothetical protein HUJ06_010753 [Nelumbo nucifera]
MVQDFFVGADSFGIWFNRLLLLSGKLGNFEHAQSDSVGAILAACVRVSRVSTIAHYLGRETMVVTVMGPELIKSTGVLVCIKISCWNCRKRC